MRVQTKVEGSKVVPLLSQAMNEPFCVGVAEQLATNRTHQQ
jgi:hypothetical protein